MKEKITVVIDGEEFVAPWRKFKTGSVGYGIYGKLLIDGIAFQVVCNIIKTESKL